MTSLARETHFHGISVDANDPARVYLATHHGLFIVDGAGKARLVSESRHDFMGFTPHPANPAILYASGHPATGGNLGFMESRDGGRSWRKLSDGVGGPVDFHQMDVSKADPNVIYGVHDDLQKSTDGGNSRAGVGMVPAGLNSLAAGSNPNLLYAATQQGLLRSTDGGKNWKPAHTLRRPFTMVHATSAGDIYAFLVGTGLIHAKGPSLNWKIVGDEFGGGIVLHLAIARADSRRLYAVTFNPTDRSQSLVTSADGGRSWTVLGGDLR